MKTIKERIVDLLEMRNKEDIAQSISDLLEDHKEFTVLELYREYIFKDHETGEDVGGYNFVVPPTKGEFFVTHNGIYEILQVTHVYDPEARPGTIHVRKAREFKTAG